MPLPMRLWMHAHMPGRRQAAPPRAYSGAPGPPLVRCRCCRWRHATDLPLTSVYAEIGFMRLRAGMASEMVLRRLHRIGQGSISADQGLLSLAVILRGPAATAGAPALPQLAVNAFIWGTYLKSSQPAFFEAMAPEQASLLQGSKKVVAAPSDIKRSVAAVASAADPAAVREQVKREVAAAIVQVWLLS